MGKRVRGAVAGLEGMDAVLAGGGDVGRQMRAIDWSKTALGPMEGWQQSLRSALSICLSSRFPIVMYWGPDFTVLYNDAYSRILGAKHPWALGQPCCVCWSEIWDTIGPMLDEVVATGEATWSDDLELMLERHGAPEECYFSFSFSPVRVEDGSVGGVFTAVVETTHRVQSERRLRLLTHLGEHSVGARSSEEACRRCIEAMGDPRVMPFALLYLCDESGTPNLVGHTGLSSASISALEEGTVPWPAAELRRTGKPALVALAREDLRPAEQWPRDSAPIEAMVLPIGPTETTQASGFLVAGVDPHQPLDADHQAFFELMAKQVSGAVADAQAYEAERRRAEALFELDRAKTEFFSNVSHEFRTPLTLLVGPLESLLEKADPGSLQAQELDLARRNALRLLKLVNTLLDFSRIDAIRKEAVFEPVDLAEFTEDLASVFRSATERAGLRLVVECPAMEQLTYIDREMWEKVVLNLLSNALKFTMAGQITVRVGKSGDHAVLTVQDTGSGISEDALPHVFDRFYRVREAESRTHEGAGIGLALVKELVGIMGGDIQVTSKLGEGTTFRVALPLAEADRALEPRQRIEAAAEPAVIRSTYVAEAMGWLEPALAAPSSRLAARPQEEPTRPGRVLLVDDNADMRAYLERILAAHWEVEAAADGVQALEAIHRRRPDLVLTDGMMPGMDGFELVSAIRDDPGLRDLPVIMLSARAGEESSVEGLNRGADDYLVKPFTVQELIARVNANLGLAGMRYELAQVRAEAQLAGDRAAFLNMAAHELRTPLTVIGGYVALILGGALEWGSDQAREALEKVAFKTKEGVRLVEQMLMAARMESGSIPVNRSSVDLRDLAQHAVDRVSELAALESQQVVAIAPDRPVMVSVDGALVNLIIDNLITNAVFHGASPITVEVMAEPPRVRVVDTGAGVADEVRDKIFEPFFQVEDELRPRRGAGLGLAVSRRLADLHGGSLILDQSEHGASFILSLPEATGVPQPAVRDQEAQARDFG